MVEFFVEVEAEVEVEFEVEFGFGQYRLRGFWGGTITRLCIFGPGSHAGGCICGLFITYATF